MFTRRSLIVFLSVLALSLLLVGPVIAGVSYNGSDYSTVPGGDSVSICDFERDFRNAYANYRDASGPRSVSDSDGAGGSCGGRGLVGAIQFHTACEGGNCTDPSYH